MVDSPPPRQRQRRRLVIQVVVAVLVVVGLLWGGDALARSGAQSLLARRLQDRVGVELRPEVAVRGWFFLPQLVRGRYNEVDIATTGITSGPLRIDHVDSRLLDVRVPFHDVLVRHAPTIGIGRSEETALLRYDDLNAYLAATSRPLTVGPAADGQVHLTGSLVVLTQRLEISADAKLSVAEGRLVVIPTTVDTPSSLSETSRLLLSQQLRLIVPLGTLPYGHQLTSVTARTDGIEVAATGTAIVLEQ